MYNHTAAWSSLLGSKSFLVRRIGVTSFGHKCCWVNVITIPKRKQYHLLPSRSPSATGAFQCSLKGPCSVLCHTGGFLCAEHFSPVFLFACSVCPSGDPCRLFGPEPDPLCMIYAACTSLYSIYDFPPVDNFSHCQISPSHKMGSPQRAGAAVPGPPRAPSTQPCCLSLDAPSGK